MNNKMVTPNRKQNKPVILLVIDTLMPVPLEEAVQTGRAPALQFLMENGRYFPHMVSSFPTMSVTIDSTLLTGTYADQHSIPGLNWYDREKKHIVNYGTGFREVFKLGFSQTFQNMFYRLNNEHLSKKVTTVHEELAKHGLLSASINSFVYRGNTPQQLHIPKLLTTMTRLNHNNQGTVNATSKLSLGALAKLRPWSIVPQLFAGNYKFTSRELRYLIRKGTLPAFTLCLFQDLDLRIHFKGPMDIKGISKIDRELQKTFDLFPSWEEALKQNVWLVMGDNGHAPMGSNYRKFIIDLRKILKSYRIATLRRSVQSTDQLVLCVNQRMAYIYVEDLQVPLSEVIHLLQHDKRIDIIAWKGQESIHIVSGLRDGRLRFSRGGEYVDDYNQHWFVEGNEKLLDMDLTEDNRIQYGDYPDGLARLYGALHARPGQVIVVNAKPGCEFKAEATPFHLGGAAHGSLHKQESLVPLIISGTSLDPEHSRIMDMKPYILKLLLS